MNLKTKLNNIKTRFKAASKAFLNPAPTLKPTVLLQTPEPSVVIDNQLLAGKNVLITGAGKNMVGVLLLRWLNKAQTSFLPI